ncbi:molybdopterin converting factor subunit 1 [Pseudohongiella acticola]|uniref:Molybdopterin synthase sulfur carrier subunit n=1 Tax=Pseudohongiella acticola TaxID=1524254 RepID=A0A1E8CN64_9GAMM|nr:molybdopterin converting factor subunit 1 [Pseudohongiella acticola]OFE13843.1 molybdopterin converting factor subunit 1 [Pseudohongiella acticola]
MYSIHYFASVREQLDCSEESIEATDAIATVADLVKLLAARGGAWTMLANRQQVLIAVNQAVSDHEQALTGNDEIAFFPPMTGG